MKVYRKRYIAVRDNKTRVLMDTKNNFYCHLPRQPQIDAMWRKWDEIGQARILSWQTKNKALTALKGSICTENINDYEIIEMTESFEFEDNVMPEPSAKLTYESFYECSACGTHIFRDDIFCRFCGRRINWQ